MRVNACRIFLFFTELMLTLYFSVYFRHCAFIHFVLSLMLLGVAFC